MSALNHVPVGDGNSIAMIVRHVSGNLVSRFTDFLTTDGEKPTRDRDGEFADGFWSRDEIDGAWASGFDIVARELEMLVEDDLTSTVTIRGVPAHRARGALAARSRTPRCTRGQIILLAKIEAGDRLDDAQHPAGQSDTIQRQSDARESGPRGDVLLEAAVESLDDALAAVEGGADRLELCANLAVGGTTPSEDLIADVVERVAIPVFVMIRPRGGSFVYSTSELDEMRRSIDRAAELDVDGFVFGVLNTSNRIDTIRTQSLVDVAGDLPVTFHRAFDRVSDRIDALDTLIDLGIGRVLTSGGAPTAIEGLSSLRDLVESAGDGIVILAGGGVRFQNVVEIVDDTGVSEVHARCELQPDRIRSIRVALSE